METVKLPGAHEAPSELLPREHLTLMLDLMRSFWR